MHYAHSRSEKLYSARVRFNPLGFLLLAAWIFIHGCAGTDQVVRNDDRKPVEQDRLPEQPIDVSKIPDAVPRYEPKSRYGNPSSYVVWGKRYYVMDQRSEFVQRGVASWYGSKFHGKRTSSGETYDMYAMTAAHKTLPLPSYLQVRNLENGRTIVVRVNDRGPFHEDRIVDLSYTAAKKLDLIGDGTGYVEIRDITPRKREKKSKRAITSSRAYMAESARYPGDNKLFVQIGAFKNPTNALRLLRTIHSPGLPASRIKSGLLDHQTVYRVQLGPIETFVEAQQVIARLSELGVRSTRIINDSTGRNRRTYQ